MDYVQKCERIRTKYDLNEIRVFEDYCEMDLYNTYGDIIATTYFDIEYLDKVVGKKWSGARPKTDIYVYCVKDGLFLHRYITNAPTGVQVDHIDLNTLNNRLSNLRLCNHSEQCWNHGYARSNTGIKGVSYIRGDGMYQAEVMCNRKRHVCKFSTLTEATKWVQKTRSDLHGKFVNHGGSKLTT